MQSKDAAELELGVYLVETESLHACVDRPTTYFGVKLRDMVVTVGS